MPNEPTRRFGDALLAAAGVSDDPASLRVLVHADWRSGSDLLGRPVLVGLGSPDSRPFDKDAQKQLFDWLLHAEWFTDVYAEGGELPADADSFPQHLLEFVRAHGAVTVGLADELNAIEQRRHARDTFPKIFALTGQQGLVDETGDSTLSPEWLLQAHGVPVERPLGEQQPSSAETTPGAVLKSSDLLADLAYLRVGLLLTFAARSADASETERAVQLTRSLGMGEAWDEFPESELEGDLDLLARGWMLSKVPELRAEARIDPLRPYAPAAIGVRPATPLQLLWLSLAVAGGAVEPPFPIDGFYRCSYLPCQRLFHSSQPRTKGENVFCSKRCGKSFWATKRMKEKRAAEKKRARTGGLDEQET